LYTIPRASNDCALVTANAIIYRFKDAFLRDFVTHPEMSLIVQNFRTFEEGMEYDMMEILLAMAERGFYHTNCMIWHLDNISNEVVIPDDALTILVKSPQHFYAYIKKGPDQWRLFDSTYCHLKRFVSFQELKILLEPFMDSKYNTAAVAIVNRQPCAVNNSSCELIASKARICGKHLVCSRCDEDDSKRAYCNEDKRFYCNICTHKDISYDGITDEDQILALLCATSEDNNDDLIPCGFDSISGSRDTAEDKTMIGISVDRGPDNIAHTKLEGINELTGMPSNDTSDSSNPCNRSIDLTVRNSPKPMAMMKFMKRPKITISARKIVFDENVVVNSSSVPLPISTGSQTSSMARDTKQSSNNYSSLLSASIAIHNRSTVEEAKPLTVFTRRPKLTSSVSATSTGGNTTDSSGTDGRSSPFIKMDRLDVTEDSIRHGILLTQSIDTITPEHPMTTGSSSNSSISSASNRRKFEKRKVLETRVSSPLLSSSLSSDLQSQTADDMTSNEMGSRSVYFASLSSQGNEEIVSQSSQDTLKKSMSTSSSSSSLRFQSTVNTNHKILKSPPFPPPHHRMTISIESVLTDSSLSPVDKGDEFEREKLRATWDTSSIPPCCHSKHKGPTDGDVSYILLWCGRHYLCSQCALLHTTIDDSHSLLLTCYQCQNHSPTAIDRSKSIITVPWSMNDCCLVAVNTIIDQCRETDSRRYITREDIHEEIRNIDQRDCNDDMEYTMMKVLAAMLCRGFDSVPLNSSRSDDNEAVVDIPESAVSILIKSSKHFYAYLKVDSDKWKLFDPSFQLRNTYLLSKELPLVLRPVLKASPDNKVVAIKNIESSLLDR